MDSHEALTSEQQKLLAGVSHLQTELRHLQNVNSNYTTQVNDVINGPREVTSNPPFSLSSSQQDLGDLKISQEKIEMKKKYDTLDEVLDMLKKEMMTASNVLSGQAKTSTSTRSKVSSFNIKSEISEAVSSGNHAPGRVKEMTMKEVLERTNPSKAHHITLSSTSLESSISTVASSTFTSLVSLASCSASSSPFSSTSSSSTWKLGSSTEELVTHSSPRILPPGMKIDLKRPPKSVNGFISKSHPQNAVFPGSMSTLSLPTKLVKEMNVQPKNGLQTTPIKSAYTDFEKAAAEELISLKDGFSSPNAGARLTNSLQVHEKNKIPATTLVIGDSSTKSQSLIKSLKGQDSHPHSSGYVDIKSINSSIVANSLFNVVNENKISLNSHSVSDSVYSYVDCAIKTNQPRITTQSSQIQRLLNSSRDGSNAIIHQPQSNPRIINRPLKSKKSTVSQHREIVPKKSKMDPSISLNSVFVESHLPAPKHSVTTYPSHHLTILPNPKQESITLSSSLPSPLVMSSSTSSSSSSSSHNTTGTTSYLQSALASSFSPLNNLQQHHQQQQQTRFKYITNSKTHNHHHHQVQQHHYPQQVILAPKLGSNGSITAPITNGSCILGSTSSGMGIFTTVPQDGVLSNSSQAVLRAVPSSGTSGKGKLYR